jgi:hypothetical protein
MPLDEESVMSLRSTIDTEARMPRRADAPRLFLVGVAAAVLASLLALSCGGLRECEAKRSQGDTDRCYLENASSRSQPKLCQRIESPDIRHQCFIHMAAQTSQSQYCQEIDDTGDRKRCYGALARALKSPAPCEALDPYGRDECIYELASTIRQIDLCPAVRDTTIRDRCLDGIARIKKDHDGCARIEDRSTRESCWVSIVSDSARQGRLRTDLCERMDARGLRQHCYAEAARANPLLCEKVGDFETHPSRIRCYDLIDWPTFAAMCGQIPNAQGMALCWQRNAVAKKDPRLCEPVRDVRMRDECLKQFVIHGGAQDELACRLVKDEQAALECIERLPRQTLKDVSICRRFRDSYRRDKCMFDVQHPEAPR